MIVGVVIYAMIRADSHYVTTMLQAATIPTFPFLLLLLRLL